jgi:hypothetical protein
MDRTVERGVVRQRMKIKRLHPVPTGLHHNADQLMDALHIPFNKPIGLLMIREHTRVCDVPRIAESIKVTFELSTIVGDDHTRTTENAKKALCHSTGNKQRRLCHQRDQDHKLGEVVHHDQDVGSLMQISNITSKRTCQIHGYGVPRS